MNKRVLILLLLTILGHCRCTFLLPKDGSENFESFVKNQIEYTFLNVAVNWEEAQIICNSHDRGSLAIVSKSEVRDFLGLALEATTLIPKQFWIGAQMLHNSSEGYYWINGDGPYIPDKYFIRRGPENVVTNRTCLAFSRQFHDIAHYINLECHLNRACICQKPYEKDPMGSLTTVDWILIDEYEYGIFYDQKTWYESVQECNNKHNSHLASFTSLQEIKIIGKFLLIGRPSLERAWIGGIFKTAGWFFISDGKEIARETDRDTKFPPWRFNRTIIQNGCLLLDRHLNRIPVFVESRCSQKRSYVCARKHENTPDKSISIINNIGYIFYYTRKPWNDALETCKEVNATLIKVTGDILHDVTYMMGENVTEIHHLWIGGRLSTAGTYFYWVEDHEQIPMDNLDIDRFPPWYNNDVDPNYACLNLDRENHNRPMFYGADCSYPQEFICVQKNLSQLEHLQDDLSLNFNKISVKKISFSKINSK